MASWDNLRLPNGALPYVNADVKTAKDLEIIKLPASMSMAGRCVAEHERSECFASFFYEKVDKITKETIVDQNVYNGTRKMTAWSRMFMSSSEVESCIKSIKIKNCEGFDRIPQRVLIEGIVQLHRPLCKLFDAIYKTKKIPEQWRISKIQPIFKKGNKNEIENYRPVANLCSTSKIFERLILNRISQLEVLILKSEYHVT